MSLRPPIAGVALGLLPTLGVLAASPLHAALGCGAGGSTGCGLPGAVFLIWYFTGMIGLAVAAVSAVVLVAAILRRRRA